MKAINKFMTVNCLVRNVSSMGAFDLGLSKFVNQTLRFPIVKDLTKGVTESIDYYLGCDNYLTRFNITQTFLKNQLFVYQGNSFDKYYNFVDFFLPNFSYYETKHEFFVNCYGLLKRTRRVLLPSESGAKENDEIIYLVYNILMRLAIIIKCPKNQDKVPYTKSTSVYLRILKKFLNKQKSFEVKLSRNKYVYRFLTYRFIHTREGLVFKFLFSKFLELGNPFIYLNSYFLSRYKFLFASWKFHLAFYSRKFSEAFLFKVFNKKSDLPLLAQLCEVSSSTFLLTSLSSFYSQKLKQISLTAKTYYNFKIVNILLFLKKTCNKSFHLELTRLYRLDRFDIFIDRSLCSSLNYKTFSKTINSIYSYIPIYLYDKRILNIYFHEFEIYYSFVYFYLFTSRARNFFKTSIVTYYSRNMSNLSRHFFKRKSIYIL
jgi:hypothetical protein